MKKIFTTVLTAAALFSFATAGFAKEETKAKSGEELFKTHCAACHPKGRNIVNPMKTLHKKDRDANNVKTATGHHKQDEKSRAWHDTV